MIITNFYKYILLENKPNNDNDNDINYIPQAVRDYNYVAKGVDKNNQL